MKSWSAFELAAITGAKPLFPASAVTGDLVNMTTDEVLSILGPPQRIERAEWRYEVDGTTLGLSISLDKVWYAAPYDIPLAPFLK